LIGLLLYFFERRNALLTIAAAADPERRNEIETRVAKAKAPRRMAGLSSLVISTCLREALAR
jgi:hypothetical protein